MPTYTLQNKKTGEMWQVLCSYNEMKEKLNDKIELVPVMPNIVSGVGNLHSKTDDGWKENLARMGEAQANTPLGERYGSKSIKDVKTRQAVDKWRKKRAADKNK